MTQLLREETPVARKDYRCDAVEYVREMLDQEIFTISDLREIVKARRQGWAIKAGQKYYKQGQVDETARQILIFRAIPAMNDLCLKYDLFPDW